MQHSFLHGFEGLFLTGMGGVVAIAMVALMNWLDRRREAKKRDPER